MNDDIKKQLAHHEAVILRLTVGVGLLGAIMVNNGMLTQEELNELMDNNEINQTAKTTFDNMMQND